jgi:hypothetical protein
MHALRQSDAAANYCLFNNLVGFDLCPGNGVVKRRYVSLHFGSAPPWAGSAKLPPRVDRLTPLASIRLPGMS